MFTDNIDAELAAWWPIIVQKQNEFYATHGHYWQARRSHVTTPKASTPAAPDNTNDIVDSICFDDWKLLPALMSACIWFDKYQSPDGFGFVLNVETQDEEGNLWLRQMNYGPEKQREQSWHQPEF